jgi:uncharacterized protein YxjI
MGLRRRRRQVEEPGRRRYVMRERLLDIGDDYWIESDDGERAFKVNGKALRLRDTFVIENAQGQELAKIQERKIRVRDAMTIHLVDRKAVVKKALIGLRDRYHVEVDDGSDLKVQGNFVDHEYEIEADGDKVAEVSKRWLRARDTYGVEVDPGTDPVLVLAVTVAVDAMSHN